MVIAVFMSRMEVLETIPTALFPFRQSDEKIVKHTMTGPLKACNSRNLFIDPHDLSRRQQGPRYSLGGFKPPSTCFPVPIRALNPTLNLLTSYT